MRVQRAARPSARGRRRATLLDMSTYYEIQDENGNYATIAADESSLIRSVVDNPGSSPATSIVRLRAPHSFAGEPASDTFIALGTREQVTAILLA